MATIHAWFSSESALRHGSTVHRKPDGSTVNVTRVRPEKDAKRAGGDAEVYVGEVIRAEDGGRVGAKSRVNGITTEWAPAGPH